VYGCSRGSARSFRLGSAGNCVAHARVSRVALAAATVAYGLERCGIDTGSTEVVVRQLGDGVQLASFPSTVKPLPPEAYSVVDSLVVRRDGAAAWIASAKSIVGHGEPDVEVHSVRGAHGKLLDSGPSIQPGSLRLHDSSLTWRHGRATRSAVLK
jgi:hypothetical protein